MKRKLIIPMVATVALLASCNTQPSQEAKDMAEKIYTAMKNCTENSNTLGLTTEINSAKLDFTKTEVYKDGDVTKYNETIKVKVNDLKSKVETKFTNLLKYSDTEGNTTFKANNNYSGVKIDASFDYNHDATEQAVKDKDKQVKFNVNGEVNKLTNYYTRNVEVTPDVSGDKYTTYGDYLNFEDGKYAELLRSVSKDLVINGIDGVTQDGVKEIIEGIAKGVEGNQKKYKIYFNAGLDLLKDFDLFSIYTNLLSGKYIEVKNTYANKGEEIKTYLNQGFTALKASKADAVKATKDGDGVRYDVSLTADDINYMVASIPELKDSFKLASGSLTISITVDSKVRMTKYAMNFKDLKTEKFTYTDGKKTVTIALDNFSLDTSDSVDYSVSEDAVNKIITDGTAGEYTPVEIKYSSVIPGTK